MDIKIPKDNIEDMIAWHPKKNGIFTVKSAYRLALSLKHRNNEFVSCSNAPNGDRSIWNLIWKVGRPTKSEDLRIACGNKFSSYTNQKA
jgi:hypothetical protein